MAQGLDALIVALAPAFAAGFAIQKLLEILDVVFSKLAELTDKLLQGKSEKISKAKEEYDKAKNALDAAETIVKAAADKTKAEAENNIKDLEQKTMDADEKVDEEKKEFKKSLKVFWTGIAAIAIGYWIVVISGLPISVLTPVMNINATSGAISANTLHINQNIDNLITILFIAAGTEGVNSILKYLGYAKEKKQEGEETNTQ